VRESNSDPRLTDWHNSFGAENLRRRPRDSKSKRLKHSTEACQLRTSNKLSADVNELFRTGQFFYIAAICTATLSQRDSPRTRAGRQGCLDLMPELQGMILMNQWPEEFALMFHPIVEETM
jgi:hypothetical protein